MHNQAKNKIDEVGINEYFLHPGSIQVLKNQGLITTLLGSCVGVAIADPVQKIAGLNHYLLPKPLFGEKLGNRYGLFAIPELILRLKQIGASPHHLEAKIYGGSSHFNNANPNLNIGAKNILMARELLKKYSIPIIEENVGGQIGRRICLDVSSFQVQHVFVA